MKFSSFLLLCTAMYLDTILWNMLQAPTITLASVAFSCLVTRYPRSLVTNVSGLCVLVEQHLLYDSIMPFFCAYGILLVTLPTLRAYLGDNTRATALSTYILFSTTSIIIASRQTLSLSLIPFTIKMLFYNACILYILFPLLGMQGSRTRRLRV